MSIEQTVKSALQELSKLVGIGQLEGQKHQFKKDEFVADCFFDRYQVVLFVENGKVTKKDIFAVWKVEVDPDAR